MTGWARLEEKQATLRIVENEEGEEEIIGKDNSELVDWVVAKISMLESEIALIKKHSSLSIKSLQSEIDELTEKYTPIITEEVRKRVAGKKLKTVTFSHGMVRLSTKNAYLKLVDEEKCKSILKRKYAIEKYDVQRFLRDLKEKIVKVEKVDKETGETAVTYKINQPGVEVVQPYEYISFIHKADESEKPEEPEE